MTGAYWMTFLLFLLAIALLIPMTTKLFSLTSNLLNDWERRKFERFSERLLWVIQGAGISMEMDDIQVQHRKRKDVYYIFDVYDGHDVVMLKTIEKKLKKIIAKEFPSCQVKILLNFRRNGRITERVERD